MKKIILYVAVMLTSCNSAEQQAESAITPAQATDAIAATPQADSLQVDATTSATNIANPASFNGILFIPPRDNVTVAFSMAGIVKNLSILPGTYVSKGTLLCTLENPQFVDLQQVYLDCHAQLEYLETEYKRQQHLSHAEVASQKKLQQSKADYLSMKSRVQAAAAQLQLLGVNHETLLQSGICASLEVKAPISGYVGSVQANLGKHLNAGEPLCELIDKSRCMLRLTAYEKDLMSVKVGNRVQFRVNGMGTTTYHASIVSIGQQVDDANRSIELYATVLDATPLFRPGMYVSARMGKGIDKN